MNLEGDAEINKKKKLKSIPKKRRDCLEILQLIYFLIYFFHLHKSFVSFPFKLYGKIIKKKTNSTLNKKRDEY